MGRVSEWAKGIEEYDGLYQVRVQVIQPTDPEREKRKEKFVKRLKGEIPVKVLNVASGATFTIANEATAQIRTILRHGDKWMMWGDCEPTTVTNHELEDFLTEQYELAQTKKVNIRITDEFGCLEWRG